MKRSDVIKLIKNTIKYTKEDHLAQRLLEVIENAGMLPPHMKEIIFTDEGFPLGVEDTWEWEPEE